MLQKPFPIDPHCKNMSESYDSSVFVQTDWCSCRVIKNDIWNKKSFGPLLDVYVTCKMRQLESKISLNQTFLKKKFGQKQQPLSESELTQNWYGCLVIFNCTNIVEKLLKVALLTNLPLQPKITLPNKPNSHQKTTDIKKPMLRINSSLMVREQEQFRKC